MAWELMNTNPLKDIEKARSEIDRLMDTFLFGKPKKTGFAEEQGWQLPVDVAETEGELIVNVEIPGVDPRDIDVSLSGDTLFIEGEKKLETEEREEDYYIAERNHGSFMRSIRLPIEVQSDKISASSKNGVLKVVLPKPERAQKKEIKIKVE